MRDIHYAYDARRSEPDFLEDGPEESAKPEMREARHLVMRRASPDRETKCQGKE